MCLVAKFQQNTREQNVKKWQKRNPATNSSREKERVWMSNRLTEVRKDRQTEERQPVRQKTERLGEYSTSWAHPPCPRVSWPERSHCREKDRRNTLAPSHQYSPFPLSHTLFLKYKMIKCGSSSTCNTHTHTHPPLPGPSAPAGKQYPLTDTCLSPSNWRQRS